MVVLVHTVYPHLTLQETCTTSHVHSMWAGPCAQLSLGLSLSEVI